MDFPGLIDFPYLFRYCAGHGRRRSVASERSEQRCNMKTATRKQVKEQIKSKGIEQAMRVPKGTLTHKMRKFAEAVALGNTGADAYRIAYNTRGKPTTVGNHASALKADDRIKSEIERIERANELAALHSAEGLRSIVISTLAEIATNPDSKDATRVQAVKAIGSLVGVDAFRETKRIEHIKDSGQIRAQILDQLKTMMLGSDDAETVEVDSLLGELSPEENAPDQEPHHQGTPQNAEWDSGSHEHSNPHEPSPSFSEVAITPPSSSETPPMPFENEDPPGDIFSEDDK